MMPVAFQMVDIVWFLLALGFLTAFFFHKSPRKLPADFEHVFQDLIRYGKTKEVLDRPGFLCLFDIPKRWFWHFYAVSVFWSGLLLIFSLRAVILGDVLPEFLTDTLEVLSGRPKSSWNGTEIPLTILMLQMLLWVHCLKRLLECLFVSVFSDGSIHVVQYAFGLGYYILLGLTVLCVDVPPPVEAAGLILSQLRWHHAGGVLLFLWASVLQYRSLALLAGLRTSGSGRVETLAYRVPHGGWFELVSCPHYLAELLIYIALGMCCGLCSLTWWLVVLCVLCNQALAAQLCHEYYKSTFKAYPHQRKAFIPFLL